MVACHDHNQADVCRRTFASIGHRSISFIATWALANIASNFVLAVAIA